LVGGRHADVGNGLARIPSTTALTRSHIAEYAAETLTSVSQVVACETSSR